VWPLGCLLVGGRWVVRLVVGRYERSKRVYLGHSRTSSVWPSYSVCRYRIVFVRLSRSMLGSENKALVFEAGGDALADVVQKMLISQSHILNQKT